MDPGTLLHFYVAISIVALAAATAIVIVSSKTDRP